MFGRKKSKPSKPSKVPTKDNYSDCDFCGERFNWRVTPALVNGRGKIFCGHVCFLKNIEKAVRHGSDKPVGFDEL